MIELPSAPTPTARVQVIHNSADLAAAKVDVWLNDEVLVNDFEFRTATPFVDAQAGVPFVVSVADSASTDTSSALAQFTFNLMEDSTYIIVANGIVSPTGYSPATPFDLDVFASAQESATNTGNTDVLVYHGSTDAPVVDVSETSVPAGLLVDSISYSEFDGYLNLPTADYTLEVADAASSSVIANFSAPLNTLGLNGEAITVLASGFATPASNSNGAAFGLWVATATGGNLLPLSLITSLEEVNDQMDRAMSIYPNPSNGSFNLSYESTENTPQLIEVLDVNGRKVKEVGLNNTTTQTVNLNEMPKGAYFLKVISNENFTIRKIIIQ